MSISIPKKILISADIFPPQAGGPATYVVSLANELVRGGTPVEIVSLNPDSDVSLVKCKMFKARYKDKVSRYVDYFFTLLHRAMDADVIYAMGPVNSGLPAMIVAKLRRKKFVVKVVGDYAWEQACVRFDVTDNIEDFQIKKYPSWSIEFLKWVESLVVRQADQVIVPSDYLKKIVLGWGAKAEKITVIYNGVDLKNSADPIDHSEEKWLVSVGRLVPWKGMDTLIEIMPELLKNFSDLKLKIVGDGPELGNLKKLVNDLRLENSVELLGNLPKEKTLSYIKSADIFILNSAYEGLSHVLLEALSLGRSILASRVGGNAEVTDNLFNYNDKQEMTDKIKNFLTSRDVEVNTKEQQNVLDKFNSKNMITKTKEILFSV